KYAGSGEQDRQPSEASEGERRQYIQTVKGSPAAPKFIKQESRYRAKLYLKILGNNKLSYKKYLFY
ncbi:hypothetical protein, partial [Clostridium butyricum]